MRLQLLAVCAFVLCTIVGAGFSASAAPPAGLLPEPGIIRGRVTDANDTPLAGASVHAQRQTCCASDSGDAVTALDGTYEIPGILAGNYSVTADAFGYQAGTPNVSPVFVSTGSVTPDVDIELAVAGAIGGRITSGATGIAGASVFAGPEGEFFTNSATTNSGGFFVVQDVNPGTYSVLAGTFGDVHAPEYFGETYIRDDAIPVNVIAGQTTPNINIDLAVGGAISGHVTLPGGGNAPNAQVAASSPEFSTGTTADGNGMYTMIGLAPGMYKVNAIDEAGAHAQTYYSDKYDEQSADDVPALLGIPSTSVDIDLAERGSISGMITGVPPLFGASISAERTVCCITAGTGVAANGPYTINDVQPGCYRVRAEGFNAGFEYYSGKFHEKTADVVCVDPADTITGVNFSLAPLDNDFIDQTTNVFALPYSNSRSTVGAGLETGEQTPCGNMGATIWYRFAIPEATPPGTTVRVDTSGTFERAFAVYSGDPLYSPPGGLSLSPIDCEGTGSLSSIDFPATAGATYYVQLGGRNGASGNVGINIFCLQDFDCDGVPDSDPDNCPGDYNPEQENSDGDAFGDVCDNDLDGDGLPNFDEHNFDTDEFQEDTDGDGCLDGAEALGGDPSFGGLRDPLNTWDFYDVNGTGDIDLSDTLAILAKFGALPGDEEYNSSFDRYVPVGNPGHRAAQAAGDAIGIDLSDALANLQSFGHSCAP